ncbi:hypothetical protein [Propioniferax innocua]|uniref:Uncharacterized protein n=1 Tax=Propioniferax innocua TaxID=1753 RepID=A0A542ZBM1_9ACTN|nr:hypothetical protein [Propioniferax innocua]TQL57735.1 hypothetical protein FB460_1577 [Propioniferax innocua]
MIINASETIMDETLHSVGQVCMLAGRAGNAVELWRPARRGFV